MASPYTDAPPDYEDLDFNEVVSELEHAHLSAIDAQQTQAAMHQAVSSADQQAAIYKEISGVSVNSRALQKEFRSAENEFSRSQQVPKGSFDQLKGCSEVRLGSFLDCMSPLNQCSAVHSVIMGCPGWRLEDQRDHRS
jgi:hypothetical protein